MDLRKLKTLIDLVQQSGIAELEITEGEEKVRISRGTSAPAAFSGRRPAASAIRASSRAMPTTNPDGMNSTVMSSRSPIRISAYCWL